MLTLYIDFKCPASYLALDPATELAERMNVAIAWKPFRSRQSAIPAEQADETRGETHRRVRAIQRRETHKHYAAIRGLEMHFREDPGETDAALAALNLDLQNPGAFVRAAFDAYWTEDADLNDPDTVASLLAASEETGVVPSADRATFDAYQAQAEEGGIFITPTFCVGEHVFVGREHLPLIEQTLAQLS